MPATNPAQQRRLRRKRGLRKRLFGTPDRPRLSVYRSNKHISAQLIDDLHGRTIVSAGSLQDKLEQGGGVAGAGEVGKLLGQRAKDAGFDAASFDRNGYRFHGRVKALASGAREAGLDF